MKMYLKSILLAGLAIVLIMSFSTPTDALETPEDIVIREHTLQGSTVELRHYQRLIVGNMPCVNHEPLENVIEEIAIRADTKGDAITKLAHEMSITVPEDYEQYAIISHTFNTGVPGPNFVIIGGVHGGERAGFMAAQHIVDNFDFPSGKFLVIPKATATAPEKWGPGGHNLNRLFPGNINGNVAQRVAAIITQLIDDFQPCIIIDMHEAYKDGFSNKILYWPNHELSQTKLEAIRFVSRAINQTELVGRHLGYYGGRDFGPDRSKLEPGTTTQVFTARYNVPAFTTETCMSNHIDLRVEQQVFIVNHLVEYFQNIYDEQMLEYNRIYEFEATYGHLFR